jgi:hypothetical protein
MKKVLGILIFLFATSLYGQVLVNTSNVQPHIGGNLSISNVDYQFDDTTFNLDRSIVGLGLAASLNPSVAFLLQAGYTFDAKYDDHHQWHGTGYMVGAGANFEFYKAEYINLVGYGLFNYIQETYKHSSSNHDLTLLDMHVGGLVVGKASPEITLYCGPEYIPYSKGKLKFNRIEKDIERADALNFKVGMNVKLDTNLTLKPEVTFLNEQTITLALDFIN